MPERILITGSGGFIGSHTVSALEKEKYEVNKFRGDIQEFSDWEFNLTKYPDANVVLLIAGVRTEGPLDLAINNGQIENYFAVAEALGILPEKVVLISTQAVYMGEKTPFYESASLNPQTLYAKSKLMAEETAQAWSNELSLPLIILRPSTVLGAGIREKSNMSGPLFVWTKAALNGKPIKVFQNGNQTRDYIHIDDLVNAILLSIRTLEPGIYNLGGGEEIKLIDLANWIKEFTKSKSEIIILGGEENVNDPKIMYSDTAKLKSCGWKPEKTAKDAVEDFIASIKA